MDLSEDQERIKQSILYGDKKIVVVDAPGGTGKTVITNSIREERPNVIVVCPTGQSALLAGGETIHRCFKVPITHAANPNIKPTYFNRKTKMKCLNARYFHKSKMEVLAVATLLVIDETFVPRCDSIDFIDAQMRIARRNPKEPFGGIRVACFGDMGQCTPIAGSHAEQLQEWGYKEPFGIMQSKVMQDWDLFQRFTLTKIWRQKNPVDARILSRVRLGKQTDLDLKTINERVVGKAPMGCTVITPLNRLSDKNNKDRMAALNSEPVLLEADRTGDYRMTKFKKLPAAPYPDKHVLKSGCRIMVKANVDCGTDEPKYKISVVNGDVGVFLGVNKRGMILDLDRLDQVVYLKPQKCHHYKSVTTNHLVTVEGEFGDHEEEIKKIEQKSTGCFTQYPVKIAYSSTINAVQGATVPRVHLHLGNSRPWEGIVYTALSRIPSFECLTLDRPITHADIKTIKGLREFQLDQDELTLTQQKEALSAI